MSLFTPESLDLGFILKKLDYDFSMDKFSDRKKLQKIIYLIQMHDVYLGYSFTYYLHGPYCTKLARTGFEIHEFYHRLDHIDGPVFHETHIQDKFEKSKKFIDNILKKDGSGIDDLEIITSIHLLYTFNMKKQDIFKKVCEKDFTQNQCEKNWNTLQEKGFIQDE